MAPTLLALSALSLGATLLVALLFMVVGSSSDSWLYRPWKLGKSPGQWWLIGTLLVTASAFALLTFESGKWGLLILSALAGLMAVAIYGGRGSRLAVWAAAGVVLAMLLTMWVAQNVAA
jgi:ABC-type transport system involved in cytochrome c biogenesis permease component